MRKLMFGGAAAALLLACPLTAMAQPSPTTPATPPAAQTTPAQPSTQTPATPAPSTFTDVQLRSFAAASTEIEPISRSITASSTAEQRTQAATQIRGILQRNNLDSTTYNAIAAQARTDTALAGRIRALGTPATSPG